MEMFKNIHFVFHKSLGPKSKQFDVQETCTNFFGTVDVWITVSFPTFFLEI